ncbi:NERD domain-containing protein [Sutcliffiella deserti]|uniref:NERD domain-containing protein n=1 Tax=Sutcliffiella deserti TaxID=2875501 RepID=UPI001CBE8606|nr:NERD domain-containing protein [Sutcliffiella deserti]
MSNLKKVTILAISVIVLSLILFLIAPFVMPLVLLAVAIYLKANYAKIKGAVGESYVNKELEKLGPMYRVFHDLYIPNEKGGTSQVDHVVTSPTGIFVIETKHYEGWIFGEENQRNWTQVIYKRKEKFLNPIWQNYGHIEALKTYLGNQKFHSIIAFSSRSTLKFEDNFNSARVIQIPKLTTVIKESKTRQLSEAELHKINRVLEKLIIQDRRQKKIVQKKHVEVIRNKQKEKVAARAVAQHKTVNRVTTNPCPKYDGQLSIKKGKYGSFYGCSHYPVCRHTQKIS